jgi:hypothetical protein
MKDLVGIDPATWLTLFGVPPTGPVTNVPTDLSSTISLQADQVFRIDGPKPWLVQIELQSTRDTRLVARMDAYSMLLEREHRLPVQSVLVLLRPSADARVFTGLRERHLPQGRLYRTFH